MCTSTRSTVFAAFALMSVFAIVGAGVVLMGLMKDHSLDGGSIVMMTIVGTIALGVVLFVGYIVINSVGNSTCLFMP